MSAWDPFSLIKLARSSRVYCRTSCAPNSNTVELAACGSPPQRRACGNAGPWLSIPSRLPRMRVPEIIPRGLDFPNMIALRSNAAQPRIRVTFHSGHDGLLGVREIWGDLLTRL